MNGSSLCAGGVFCGDCFFTLTVAPADPDPPDFGCTHTFDNRMKIIMYKHTRPFGVPLVEDVFGVFLSALAVVRGVLDSSLAIMAVMAACRLRRGADTVNTLSLAT
jgi:hypothetical protein